LPEQEIAEYLGDIASVIGKCVDQMPTHAAFIKARCAAS
jgi:tryptophan halogenase